MFKQILCLTIPLFSFFWREKEPIKKQMFEQRRIVVSVLREKKMGLDNFNFKGAGIISAPKDFCFKHALKFERLKGLSSHFKSVDHVPDKKKLYIVVEALGYESRMLLDYKVVEGDEIQWTVIGGTMKGMRGKFTFTDQSKGKTEVSIFSDMEADQIPLPSILAPFTLEIIAENVAQKMREDMEKAFKESNTVGVLKGEGRG